MMNHEQTQSAISRYLRGELTADEQRDLLAHVRDCPRCGSELAIARRLQRELPQAAPYRAIIGVPLPAALAARVRASVASQQGRRPLGWMEWLFPGAQPNLRRGVVNVLAVFLLLLSFAVGVAALRNAFQPGPPRPGYQANFAYAAEQGRIYVFTDTTITTDTLTYRWDFGDGGSSNLRNPRHHYGVTGVYTVAMSVSGPHGTGDKSLGVQVGPIVAVTASPMPTALPSATVYLPGLFTATPALLPMLDTATPPATDTPSLIGPPSPTLPSSNPLPSATTTSSAQPTVLLPQPSPTPPLLPNYGPTGTPLPQPTITSLPQPSNTALPQPTSTPVTVPSDTPPPLTKTPTSAPLTTPTSVPSHTQVPTGTPRIVPSDTPLPQPSDTPLPQPSDTPAATHTPDCGFHCGPTETPVPPTHMPTDTPPPTETPIPTHEPPSTHTPGPPTATPTATPTHHPPPPTWTPHDLTMTPGPTCTPHEGNEHDNC